MIRYRVMVVVLLFLVAVFLCEGVTHVSMLADDAASLDWGRQMLEQDFWTPWFGGIVEHGQIVQSFCRPLTHLTYGLDWKLWGRNPAGWRIENVMLHFLTSVLVFLLAERLMPGSVVRAAVAALFFALHPCHELAFWWITCRNDPLCGLFFVASVLTFLYYLDTRQRAWMATSILTGVCALFSKEVAFSLPLVLASVAIVQPAPFRQRVKNAMWAAPLAVIATLFLALRFLNMPAQGILFAAQIDLPHIENVFYLACRHFIFPYHVSLKASALQYPILTAGLAVLMGTLAILRWRRLATVPMLIAVAWVGFSFLPLIRTMSAWGLYVPSVGLALATAWLLQPDRTRTGVLATVFLAVVLVSFVAHFQTRKTDWQYAGRIAHDTLEDVQALMKEDHDMKPAFVTVPASVAGVPIFMDHFRKHLRQVTGKPSFDPLVLSFVTFPQRADNAPITVSSPDSRTFQIVPAKTAIFEFPEGGDLRYKFLQFHDGQTLRSGTSQLTLHGVNTDKSMTSATAYIDLDVSIPKNVYVYSEGHFRRIQSNVR